MPPVSPEKAGRRRPQRQLIKTVDGFALTLESRAAAPPQRSFANFLGADS